MCKNEQTIHYCTILSAGQWNFLLDGKAAIDRQKCLYRLMTAAVRTNTVLHIKDVEIALEVGQAAASDVELAEYMGCNRKTIGKLIDSFNRLGMLTTRTNNRTSIHTLHFFYGVVCRWCPADQSPLCQACGSSQRTGRRSADTILA